MEILRLKNTTSLNFTVSDLVPSQEYYAEFYDLLTLKSYSASATADLGGNASFLIPSYYKKYDGTLLALVTNYMDEQVFESNIEVLRPYCDIARLATQLDISIDAAKSYERVARSIIDSIAHKFYYVRKEKEIIGNGSDYLMVDEDIVKLHKVYENKELLYDVELTDNKYEFEISLDRYSIVLKSDQYNRLNYPKVWIERNLDVTFPANYDYVIDADFGWLTIPQDIQEASEILIQSFTNDSMKYASRYISEFSNEDFKVKFVDKLLSGSGNMIVDKILDKYKNRLRVGVF